MTAGANKIYKMKLSILEIEYSQMEHDFYIKIIDSKIPLLDRWNTKSYH